MNIPGLPPYDAHDNFWNMPEVWREQYVSVKYGAAERFKPKSICEIGVYSGIAAKCFMAASPEAHYVGIDNLHEEKVRGVHVWSDLKEFFVSTGYYGKFYEADSQQMETIPDGWFDFIHVDGDHSRKGAAHDVYMAWKALTPEGVMLIDDGHDMGVASGVFDAMYRITRTEHTPPDPYLVDWRYYEENPGSILIFKRLKQ